MQGKRLPDNTEGHLLKPGEYSQQWHGCAPFFYACSPDGRLANLSSHTVTIHDDQTITVSPSILVSGGGDDGSWHGYLERGVWRQV